MKGIFSFLVFSSLVSFGSIASADYCQDRLQDLQGGFDMTYKITLQSVESWDYDQTLSITGRLIPRAITLKENSNVNGDIYCRIQLGKDFIWDTAQGKFRMRADQTKIDIQYNAETNYKREYLVFDDSSDLTFVTADGTLERLINAFGITEMEYVSTASVFDQYNLGSFSLPSDEMNFNYNNHWGQGVYQNRRYDISRTSVTITEP